jgi:hypothetical protein
MPLDTIGRNAVTAGNLSLGQISHQFFVDFVMVSVAADRADARHKTLL